MKNCIVSQRQISSLLHFPLTDQIHPGNYLPLRMLLFIEARYFHVHGSLVAFSIRVYVCERSTNVVRNLEEKWNGNEFRRYVIYEKSRSRIFEMDDRGLREIRALCEVNNGASGTSNANDPLKTEIPKRVAIATESIPPSMID